MMMEALDPLLIQTVAVERRVVETAESWTLPDSVVAVPGVFNKLLRPWDEWLKTARMFEGVPIIYAHPDAPVLLPKDLKNVGGRVTNVRVDEKGKRILADYVLWRKAVPGWDVSQAALKANLEVVTRMRADKPIENSVGYLYRVQDSKGTLEGKEYTQVARDLVPNHLALLGVAGDHTPAACPWPTCGPGAAQTKVAAESETPPPAPAPVVPPAAPAPAPPPAPPQLVPPADQQGFEAYVAMRQACACPDSAADYQRMKTWSKRNRHA